MYVRKYIWIECSFIYFIGLTPLIIATIKKNHEAIQLLFEYGAQVNVMDNIRRTPLHIAAERGYIEIIGLLLNSGANANVLNNVLVGCIITNSIHWRDTSFLFD